MVGLTVVWMNFWNGCGVQHVKVESESVWSFCYCACTMLKMTSLLIVLQLRARRVSFSFFKYFFYFVNRNGICWVWIFIYWACEILKKILLIFSISFNELFVCATLFFRIILSYDVFLFTQEVTTLKKWITY